MVACYYASEMPAGPSTVWSCPLQHPYKFCILAARNAVIRTLINLPAAISNCAQAASLLAETMTLLFSLSRILIEDLLRSAAFQRQLHGVHECGNMLTRAKALREVDNGAAMQVGASLNHSFLNSVVIVHKQSLHTCTCVHNPDRS